MSSEKGLLRGFLVLDRPFKYPGPFSFLHQLCSSSFHHLFGSFSLLLNSLFSYLHSSYFSTCHCFLDHLPHSSQILCFFVLRTLHQKMLLNFSAAVALLCASTTVAAAGVHTYVVIHLPIHSPTLSFPSSFPTPF